MEILEAGGEKLYIRAKGGCNFSEIENGKKYCMNKERQLKDIRLQLRDKGTEDKTYS